jgi:hypothetical protein
LLLAEKRHAIAAAIIFMVAGSHGEALFWISSLNGVVENVISLASLILFILWRQKGSKGFFALSLILFALALLSKESAISLVIILALYDFLLADKFGWMVGAKRTAASCWPFAAAGLGFILIRSIVMRQADLPAPLTTFQWSVMLAGPWRAFVMTLSPVDWSASLGWFYSLFENRSVAYFIMAVMLSALAIVPLALRRFRLAFLVLWIPAAAAPLFALGLVPSERHAVVSSAGAAILLAILFFGLSERVARKSAAASVVIGMIFVAAFAAPNLAVLKQTQSRWERASKIANDVIQQTISAYPHPPANTTMFFLNIPDSIGGAFVFRFENMRPALQLYYGDDSIDVVRIVTLDRIRASADSGWQVVYIDIGAMGGNIYAPEAEADEREQSIRWQELNQLGILGKDFRYIDNWRRYESSPFLAYSDEGLEPLPPEELKKVVDNLYSLR